MLIISVVKVSDFMSEFQIPFSMPRVVDKATDLIRKVGEAITNRKCSSSVLRSSKEERELKHTTPLTSA